MKQTNDSWEEVRGILKNKKVDAIKYQRKIRKEWDRNFFSSHLSLKGILKGVKITEEDIKKAKRFLGKKMEI